jgi:hypothetical protein
MTDQLTDRYFRFMLEAVGVKWLNRWMMWAAVAFRTRWCGSALKKALLSIWVLAACAGISAAVFGVVTGTWWLVGVAAVAPLAFSLLWQRQYGAGVVAAYTAAWVLPPTILGMIGYWIYLALEEGPVRLVGLNKGAHVRTIGPSAASDRRDPDRPRRARDRTVGPDRSANATT